MFENVLPGPKDPMFDLKKQADNDKSARKVDLGVGIYRNQEGNYHEINAVYEVRYFTNLEMINFTLTILSQIRPRELCSKRTQGMMYV